MKFETKVSTHGGLFRAPKKIVTEGVDTMRRNIGEEGVRMIRRRLDRVLVNPTGHYRSRIDYTLRSDEIVEIHDSGVIYGPWLEGVSTRNATTRFKGYATFRKTLQDLEQKVDRLVEPDLRRMAGRLE